MKAKQQQVTAIEYLEANSLSDLATRVNVAIEQGWQPFDGTRHYKPSKQVVVFIQAVVK